MIFTARQLEDLHKTNGHVVLPYGARLTPLAVDWAKGKKIAIGYGPDELVKSQGHGAAKPQAALADAPAGAYLWWCDGPCGAAKAAVGAQGKESSIAAIDLTPDPKQLVPVIKQIAAAVKNGKSAGGVLLVHSGAAAVVLANRCPALRAILGTTLESLEAGISQVAANVLVIEYPGKTFPQIKNLLSRFVRAKRELGDDVKRQMLELSVEPASAGCGCGGGGRH
jgi:ribose 5-phosphate isomerase RpiB